MHVNTISIVLCAVFDLLYGVIALKKSRVFMRLFILFVATLILANCSASRKLVTSPNLYAESDSYPQVEIPRQQRTTTPKLLYITDRFATKTKNGHVSYGAKRSSSMAFGELTVAFGKGLSWQVLKKASAARNRKSSIVLGVTGIKETIRFPETPVPFGVKNGRIVETTAPEQMYNRKKRLFQKTLSSYLAAANSKEVVLFVHGYNNSFEEAALSLADIWHFTGRVGVPMLYSWPAGNGGFTGYFKDRESGEFSVFHFKETISMIAKTPGVKRIHIVAHSRGTDVVTTALRELVIADRAAGRDPGKSLKIQNLILAAPDLDFGVVRQRLIAERFGPAIGQITVYMNQSDGALNLAQLLMAGKRFGRIKESDLNTNERAIFARVKNVHFIDVENVGGFIGHDYFRKNPGVLSDIAITVQKFLAPGDKGRPLRNLSGNFWLLPKNYPFAN